MVFSRAARAFLFRGDFVFGQYLAIQMCNDLERTCFLLVAFVSQASVVDEKNNKWLEI